MTFGRVAVIKLFSGSILLRKGAYAKMSSKRLIALFGLFLALFTVVQLRIFALMLDPYTADTAKAQSTVSLQLSAGRGEILDREGRSLIDGNNETMALALPGDSSYAKLYRSLSPDAAASLYNNGVYGPSLVSVESLPADQGIYTFTRPGRYFETPTAVHLIGYLDGDGKGASGIEKAYNDVLARGGTKTFVRCETMAAGGLMQGTEPEVYSEEGTSEAVQMTLSLPVQRLCEAVAESRLTSGAVVVLDTKSGEILGLASVPQYDPLNVAKSIKNGDTALLCRATAAYNVGSVFKPIVAAAALEAGMDENAVYECTGEIEVAGHKYHCAKNKAHGSVDMKKALEQSCNCYFIQLAQQMEEKDTLCSMARRAGFGRGLMLWDNYLSAAGNLPDVSQMTTPGEFVTLSFGQGQLLASPLQLAGAINAIANDGVYIAPTAVKGIINQNTGEVVSPGPTQETLRIMKPETAKTLQKMLEAVITEGIAGTAAPQEGLAAGKTGTAQTGRMNENEEELYDAWFAGFYPSESPRYTIVVFEDSTTRSGEALSPVFAELCNSLALFKDQKID